MSKHTPGPWEAAERGDYFDLDGNSRVILGDDRRIAIVQHSGREADAANTRLIAAAPDLLDALEAIDCESDWLMACCVAAESCGRGPVHPKQTARSLIAKVRDAIAKAEGEGA